MAAFLTLVLISCSPDFEPSVPEISLTAMEPQVVAKLTDLRERVVSNPKDADAWGRLGINLYAHEHMPEAALSFEYASRLDPGEIRWPYFCAITLYSLGEDEALAWFKKAVKLQPDNPQLHVRMGDAYLTEGKQEVASEHYRKALELDGKRADALVGLAQIDYDRKQWAEAAARLEEAVRIEPNMRRAHALLVSCYRMLWQQDKVIEASKRLNELKEVSIFIDPIIDEIANEGVSIHWYMERAVQYMETGQPAAAVAELRRALVIRPDAAVYSMLGTALVSLDKPDSALACFRKAHELSPGSAMYTFNLGFSLCDAGQTGEGIPLLEEAWQTVPAEEKYSAMLFDQYVLAGRWADALRLGPRVYGASPKNLSMGLKVAWLLATCPRDAIRNGAKAVQMAETIVGEMSKPYPEALDCLAAAYAEAGHYDRAMETISNAIEMVESAKNQAKVTGFREREKSYLSKRPWRSREAFGG